MKNKELKYLPPRFNGNGPGSYRIGYAGFTRRKKKDVVACGITHFTGPWSLADITPTHVLLCTGEDECVEALAEGVVKMPLQRYFEDPNTEIFFRRPRRWTSDMGERIRRAAYRRVGRKYGYALIAGNAIANSMIGKALTGLTRGWFGKAILRLFDSESTDICNEVASECLNEQPELYGVGVLRLPSYMINPKMLFSDDGVFEPWKWERV
jgi:hypothetical protein